MNETLKQIAVEAKVEHCISHVRLQEFAELIIRECVAICNNANGASYLNGVYAGKQIKAHFGIEE